MRRYDVLGMLTSAVAAKHCADYAFQSAEGQPDSVGGSRRRIHRFYCGVACTLLYQMSDGQALDRDMGGPLAIMCDLLSDPIPLEVPPDALA